MRLRDRTISREEILALADTYELLETYPRDKYLPSYLAYGENDGDMMRILFAVDTEGHNARVVTAYRPNPEEWDKKLRISRPG